MKMNGKKTPWYVLRSPELGKPFQEFYKACETEGVLDNKTKTLIKLVCVSALYPHEHAKNYMTEAYNAGVSKEEITEALLIAAAETAQKNISWLNEISDVPYQNDTLEHL